MNDEGKAMTATGASEGGPPSPAGSGKPPFYWERYIDAEGRWKGAARPAGEDLAALRRGIGREAGTVPGMWPFYTTLTTDGAQTTGLRAEHLVLGLYALHQQGRLTTPLHSPGIGVGRAMARLKASGRYSPDAVDRRFGQAATAADIDEVAYHLRGLITQLRSVDVPIALDYTRLFRDLRAWHYPDQIARIRRQWGRDYFGRSSTSTTTSDDPSQKENN